MVRRAPGGPLTALLALTPFVLEPMLVARTGATLGHRLLGLRVVEVATGRPPGLLQSFGRYFVKVACLGPWLSPVIAITRRHQGIHDLLCDTVVEVVDPDSRKGRLAAYDPAKDAVRVGPGPRVLSTVGYSLGLLGAITIVGLLTSEACVFDGRCGPTERVVFDAASRLWFLLQYAVLWLGPAGRLPGVRTPTPAMTAASPRVE